MPQLVSAPAAAMQNRAVAISSTVVVVVVMMMKMMKTMQRCLGIYIMMVLVMPVMAQAGVDPMMPMAMTQI